MRTAIYARISDDRDRTGLGVQRQLDDCRKLAEQRGWTIAGEHVDNDLSAYSGKPRPAYLDMMQQVRDNRYDVVIAWANDRLHRHPRELEDFIDAIETSGAQVVTVSSGAYDLSSPEGRAMARVVGAMARQESERKSVRNRRKHEELAEAGRPSGGGTRPYGYEPDRMTIREDEAVVVKEAVARTLAGESLGGLCSDLTDRGVATVKGGRWWPTTLRSLLISGRIAGLRYHRNQLVGDATWPAIISREDHERLRAILLDPARRKANPWTRSHCLTGLLWCGRCGARVMSGRRKDRARQYVCKTGAQFDGCGRLTALAEPLEAYLGALCVDALATDQMDRVLYAADTEPDSVLAARIQADEAALTELTRDFYVERAMGKGDYLAARRALEERIDQARSQLAEHGGPRLLASLPESRDELQAAWDAGDVPWRTALLRAVIDRVVISPAVKGQNFFNPGRVHVEWRA